jgi:RsiW-degrading membrane proteinase PrsW (M82 family)
MDEEVRSVIEDEHNKRKARLALSFAVYVVGTVLILAFIYSVFHTDPVSWPITIAILCGYFLGRITRGIEQ